MSGPDIDFEYLERRFGLRRLDPDSRADAERLSRAQAIFEKAFGRKATMLTDHFPVLLNEDVLYLPDVYIGSLGCIVERASERIHTFGSAYRLEDWVWAYFKGDRGYFDTWNRFKEDESLIIFHRLTFHWARQDEEVMLFLKRQVHNLEATVVSGSIDCLPLTIETQRAWSHFNELRLADDFEALRFDMETVITRRPWLIRKMDEPMDKEWLKQKITVEEAERAHLVSDPRLGEKPVPFGFCNKEWRELLDQMQPGDELWSFRSPRPRWKGRTGRAGVVLVRNGDTLATIETLVN